MADKNLPDKVDELLTEVVNRDPIVLASLSAVPYFGGTLATFFSAKWLEIHQQRTAELFRQLSEHLSNLNEQAIRSDYFDTPEGIDLLIKATEASSKTRSADKRDLIARILAGATTYKSTAYSPEEYLHLLSDLTEKELMVARSIYKAKFGVDRNIFGWTSQVREELNLDGRDLFVILTRLEARGLLQTVDVYSQDRVTTSKGRSRILGSTDKKGIERIDRILVTPAFTKLMRFLDLDT